MKNLFFYFITISLLTGLIACKPSPTSSRAADGTTSVIDSVKSVYAPDKRVAIFDIEARSRPEGVVLRGESNLPEAVDALKTALEQKKANTIDSIALLPSAALNGLTQAVVKISVANLRGAPKHSSELVTQATLGIPLKVYKKEANWYLIQTPDQYLGWVDSGGIELMNEQRFANWKTTDKLIYLKTFGKSFAEADADSQMVSDLVAGDILELQETSAHFYKVKYPDGRTAFVPREEAQPYERWLASLDISENSLVNTSKTLMGLPYLWGGTSPKGVDCSGFTKTIYFLNGLVIPRDASQQIHTGLLVDDDKSFKDMRPGDLLFFGKPATDSTKERVVHVGMWIGNNEFIHSSGRVQVSSMDKNAPNYDAYNYNRYLRSKRLLGQQDKGLVYLAERDVFKD